MRADHLQEVRLRAVGLAAVVGAEDPAAAVAVAAVAVAVVVALAWGAEVAVA